MKNVLSDFQEEISKIMREGDKNDVKPFTYSLISLAWGEFCVVNEDAIDEKEVKSVAEEVRQAIEIMNPELYIDIILLKKLLKILDDYQ